MKNINVSNRLFIKSASLVIGFAMMGAPFLTHAATLNRQLQLGMSGSDVSSLQGFLAQDATIYPQGLVTGYFGFLTKSAVSNFQSRNNISAVGRVGPVTLVALNAQMGGGIPSSNYYAPTISGVSVNTNNTSATVYWNTNESAKGVVYYSSTPLVTYEYENSVSVSGATAMTDASFRSSQGVLLQNLNSNTTYYYMVYVTDQDGYVSVTGPLTFRTN